VLESWHAIAVPIVKVLGAGGTAANAEDVRKAALKILGARSFSDKSRTAKQIGDLTVKKLCCDMVAACPCLSLQDASQCAPGGSGCSRGCELVPYVTYVLQASAATKHVQSPSLPAGDQPVRQCCGFPVPRQRRTPSVCTAGLADRLSVE